jgi:hypothetical protein
MDSSISVLNEYQKVRLKTKIKKENSFFAAHSLLRRMKKPDTIQPVSSSVVVKKSSAKGFNKLPQNIKNDKANLNNDDRKRYIEMFNKINFSRTTKMSKSKSSFHVNDKIKLLYK